MALNGLRETVKLINNDVAALKDGGVETQYSAADQKKICDAFKYVNLPSNSGCQELCTD